jgi:hypothetical protein
MRLHLKGILILLAASGVLLYGLTSWRDLHFGDEATYLASGVTFNFPQMGGAQWGPLYATWYGFLNLFAQNQADLYYLNLRILSTMAGILVFLYFLSSKAPFWASVWVAVLYLFSSQNLPLEPKISIAPFCLILGCLSVVQFYDFKHWQKFLWVAFTALICAYCRPEFYISFVLGTALCAWFLWKERTIKKKSVVFFVIGAVGLHLLFGNPLFSGEGGRSAVAFQQHFISNYARWQQQPDPPTIELQLQLFHQIFGAEVESMTDALRAKPALVFRHIFSNVQNTVVANVRNVAAVFYETPLQGLRFDHRSVLFWLAAAFFLARINYPKTRQNLPKVRVEWSNLLALLVFLVPSLVATVLVYPRTHYLVFHLLLVFWVVAWLFRVLVFKPLPFLSATSSVLLVVFLAWCFVNRPQTPTPHADNVRFINGLDYKKEIVSLEREWYRVFLKKPSIWEHVEQYQFFGGDFKRFVRERGVNFILITQDMQQYFAKDAGFAVFLRDAPKEGFLKFKTNNYGDYLLIKSDLIGLPQPTKQPEAVR